MAVGLGEELPAVVVVERERLRTNRRRSQPHETRARARETVRERELESLLSRLDLRVFASWHTLDFRGNTRGVDGVGVAQGRDLVLLEHRERGGAHAEVVVGRQQRARRRVRVVRPTHTRWQLSLSLSRSPASAFLHIFGTGTSKVIRAPK